MRYYLSIVILISLMINLTACSEQINMDKKNYNKLTAEEERIITHKGTEAPFSGTYNKFSKKGFYHCKRCDNKLYTSEDKFDSNCGWPSFDDEIQGAIKRNVDADGIRTEILCANCDAHLGHIFKGEGFTDKNIRHCVNSISLKFIDDIKAPLLEKAYFAGGCFWGVEYFFDHKEGVLSAVSGYMGGALQNPSYKEVVNGNTGHLEVVEITYDPSKVTYETLAKLFFEIHDPTQANGQGPDIGKQYLSAIFYQNDSHKQIAQKLIDILKTKGYDVVTALHPENTFWKAEAYHQDYYDNNKQKPYCHIYKKKF